MTHSDFNAIQIIDDVISIRRQNKKSIRVNEVRITDEGFINLVTSVRELIESLIVSKGSWKNNNNQYLMTLVTESMKVVKGYKFLSIDDKKRLVMLIIDKIVEKEIASSDMEDEIKNKLLTGIDEVVEPSIELAIRAIKGELKLNQNSVMKILGLVVSAIFICTKKSRTE
jgi:hypothetical protein